MNFYQNIGFSFCEITIFFLYCILEWIISYKALLISEQFRALYFVHKSSNIGSGNYLFQLIKILLNKTSPKMCVQKHLPQTLQNSQAMSLLSHFSCHKKKEQESIVNYHTHRKSSACSHYQDHRIKLSSIYMPRTWWYRGKTLDPCATGTRFKTHHILCEFIHMAFPTMLL
jgi:hypothetical protein